MRRWALAAALFLPLSCGCAHFVRLEIPDEFKKKKLKEDPPITWSRPLPSRTAMKEA